MSVLEDFPQLSFTARNGSGKLAREATRALTELRVHRSEQPLTRRGWDDEFHRDLASLVTLIYQTARGRRAQVYADSLALREQTNDERGAA